MTVVDDPGPDCRQHTGLPRRIETVPGHLHTVLVTMVCPSCGHQWRVEHRDALLRPAGNYP
jgi:hypothetical protein